MTTRRIYVLPHALAITSVAFAAMCLLYPDRALGDCAVYTRSTSAECVTLGTPPCGGTTIKQGCDDADDILMSCIQGEGREPVGVTRIRRVRDTALSKDVCELITGTHQVGTRDSLVVTCIAVQ